MENIGLWLKAIKDRLETVRVSGHKDISTMAAVLNTLDDLIGKSNQEEEKSNQAEDKEEDKDEAVNKQGN